MMYKKPRIIVEYMLLWYLIYKINEMGNGNDRKILQ